MPLLPSASLNNGSIKVKTITFNRTFVFNINKEGVNMNNQEEYEKSLILAQEIHKTINDFEKEHEIPDSHKGVIEGLAFVEAIRNSEGCCQSIAVLLFLKNQKKRPFVYPRKERN